MKLGFTINEMNLLSANTLIGYLGIKYTEIGDKYIKGTMPIDERTTQPMGWLHGGAAVTLAETLGSMGSLNLINKHNYMVTGIEINANHVKKATNGLVYGHAELISETKQIHVWQIHIKNEDDEIICLSRLTVLIIKKNNEK